MEQWLWLFGESKQGLRELKEWFEEGLAREIGFLEIECFLWYNYS